MYARIRRKDLKIAIANIFKGLSESMDFHCEYSDYKWDPSWEIKIIKNKQMGILEIKNSLSGFNGRSSPVE